MQQAGPPTVLRLLRMMYWSVRRDWRRAPHLAAVLPGAALNWLRLRWWRHVIDRRAPVAIALMERIGDIIAAEPVARHARAQFPDAPILWVTTAPYAALPRRFPAIDRVLTVRCVTEWLLLWRTGAFRTVMDLHLNASYCVGCVISVPKPGAAAAITPGAHLGHGNLLAVRCRCAGLPLLADAPRFEPAPASRRRVDALRLPAEFVVIHCTASDAAREWQDAHWRALAAFTAGPLGLDVIEIGLSARAVAAGQARQRSLCGLLSLEDSAEVIRRARLFIGIDSGPAHLANAVRTPGIVLLGRFGGFARYMPYSGGYESGELGEQLWADGPLATLPLPPVLAAVERRLAAPPRNTAATEPA
jgi:heptosyltransferase-3